MELTKTKKLHGNAVKAGPSDEYNPQNQLEFSKDQRSSLDRSVRKLQLMSVYISNFQENF